MRSYAALFVVLVTLASQANAVTVKLSTTIDVKNQNYFGTGVTDFFKIGDTVNFSFNYTPDDSIPAGDWNGMKYVVTDFTIDTPAYSATVLNRGAIKFTHANGYDQFVMSSGYSGLTSSYGVPLANVPLLNGYYLSSVGLSLNADRGGVFTSDSLKQPLRKDMFNSASFFFDFREPGTTRAMGTMQSFHIDSLTSSISPVPEPSTELLFGAGILALALRVRQKKYSKKQ